MASFGKIVKTALLRADLPFDVGHIELAKDFCNENINLAWYKTRADYRASWDQVNTVPGSTEYVVSKFLDQFVKYSLRGPSTDTRYLSYLPPEEYFRRIRDQESNVSNPTIFTDGQMMGIDQQLTSTSKVQVFSSLANKTAGTVKVLTGQKKIVGTGTVFNTNDVGLMFKKDGDAQSYKIGRYISATEIELDDIYRGVSSSGSTYKVGDIGIKCNIQGFVGGQITSEEVELDGETIITSEKTFTALTSCSKEQRTGGNVYFRNAGSSLNVVATLAPAETEIERKTIVLWPQPDTVEALKYRFYMKHPVLWLDSDRLLLPEKYHPYIAKLTEIDLRGWAGKDVPEKLMGEIVDWDARIKNDGNDTSLEDLVPDSDDERPYGNYYNHDLSLDW